MLTGDAASVALYDEGSGVADDGAAAADAAARADVPFPLLLQQAHDPRLEQSMEESPFVPGRARSRPSLRPPALTRPGPVLSFMLQRASGWRPTRAARPPRR